MDAKSKKVLRRALRVMEAEKKVLSGSKDRLAEVIDELEEVEGVDDDVLASLHLAIENLRGLV